MSIDEVITELVGRLNYHQKIIDTHILFDDVTLEEFYCDDTGIVYVKLQGCEEEVEILNMAIHALEMQKKLAEKANSGEVNYYVAKDFLIEKEQSE